MFVVIEDGTSKVIKQGESETFEFKQSFNKSEVSETLSAMANRNGGNILIGVTNKGEIKGAQLGKETFQEWLNFIGQLTEPKLIPSIYEEEVKGKTIARIEIPSYPIKPVTCAGRVYLRVTSSNKQLTSKEISELHLQSTNSSWDAYVAKEKAIKDISLTKVKSFIRTVNSEGRRKLDGDIKHMLRKMNLVIKDKPTWACFLLFRKNLEDFPQAVIRIGRFKGSSTIIDDKTINGDLISQVDEVVTAIQRNIRVRYEIKGRIKRHEVWDYPIEALREIILNAICHRDYNDNADIQIKIFEDRIIFWNPGKLQFDVTIEQLLADQHISKPRNRFIAQAFYDLGEIERFGSGIKRVFDLCEAAELPKPQIREFVEALK
jgi:ATP-dependent DNA helicase RecG